MIPIVILVACLVVAAIAAARMAEPAAPAATPGPELRPADPWMAAVGRASGHEAAVAGCGALSVSEQARAERWQDDPARRDRQMALDLHTIRNVALLWSWMAAAGAAVTVLWLAIR